jgi:fibronectin-binding autotransporter adhesin
VPPVTNNYVERGNEEVFTHTVRNIGTVNDRYDIDCASNLFTVTVCASQTITVPAGGSTVVATSVEIPTNLSPYQVGQTFITATSQVSSTLSDAARVNSTVALRPGVSFTPHISRTELPGAIITLTHVLTNTGDAFDSFTVTKIEDTNGWATLLPQDPFTVSLNSGMVQNVRVQIQVPAFAPQGLSNIIRIEAVSNFDPDISATVVETITAKATTGTRYVSTLGNDQDNNCTQSDKPCGTVDHAVGQVAAGDEVRIAPGLYTESGINVNDSIHISGGWSNFGDNGQGDEPNPNLTVIDANNLAQIFVIGAGNSTISDLTLSRGFASNGGAVFVNNPSQIGFENVIFDDNTATNRGGAVFMNSGTSVSVQNSFFTNNVANLEGGAFYMSGGTLSISQARFITNTAASTGGGGFGMNGGILYAQNNLFNNNNTNGSGGGVRLNGGTANFNFNTWVENAAVVNGGGVYNNGATATIQNSIFADNTAVSNHAVYQNAGTTTLDYLNLWNNTANTPIGSHSFTANPLFGDEQFRLGDGSPAIDTADPNAAMAVDFEGDFRPSDEGFDIGYDERAGCRAMRDETIYGSIQDAVDVTDAESDLILVSGICRGVHTIDVGGSVISQTVHLTKSLMIQGGWNGDFSKRTMETTIVDPESRGRGFLVTNGVSVTIAAISVTNGAAIDLGGAQPITGGAGGGIYNVDGDLKLRGVTIVSGTAVSGAGFYNEAGSALITWELIEGDPDEYNLSQIFTNTAVSGGGIFNDAGELTVDGVWLAGNQAQSGGGVFMQGGVITVVNTVLDQNTASLGGGVYNEALTATVAHNTFYTNTATSNGGGVYDSAGTLLVDSNIFESNQAAAGSAIFATDDGTQADYNYYYDNSGTAVSGAAPGTHSIASATPPGLIDPAAGDFHLEEEAPAADKGNPDSVITHDFEDDPRPSNQGFDIGADEIVGCMVMLNDVLYGSLQAAIDDAQPGDEIYVSGVCSGVHSFDTGLANACGGDEGQIQTAVHLTKSVNLLGGWDEAFENREGLSVLDAKTLGRVLYIGPGVTSTVDGFEMINGLLTGPEANGAGICIDQASPTIQNNRIYSNTAAADGGGVYSFNSEPLIQGGNYIYENEAVNGGGVYIDVASGEVFTSSLHNNFIYFNQAVNGGGVYANRGAHSLWHNTVVSNTATTNGGGFYMAADASGAADMRGLIIMGNVAASGGGVYGAGSIPPALSYNNYYQNTPIINFGGNASGGVGSIAVDPLFANPISGVFTITIASPVVDISIPNMPLAEDYEGDIRPSHQAYDLGADEVGGCYAIIQGSPSIVYGSVQTAVDEAADGDTILVDGVCQNVNSRLVGGNLVSQTLVLTKSVTIDGSWEYLTDTSEVTTTLDALNRGRVLYVAPGVNVTVTNILLEHGAGAAAGNGSNGGAVYNAGTLSLIDAWVQNSTAVSGAGLYNAGSLVVSQTAVLTNTAQQSGGGLYNAGPAVVTGSEFRNNRIGQHGGAVFQQSGALYLDGNRLHRNGFSAVGGSLGGGVYLNSGAGSEVDVRNNFIYLNQAETGGGLYNVNTNARVWHNTFVNNTANSDDWRWRCCTVGGALDIRNNIVDNNYGSGVYARSGSPLIDYNLVYNTFGFSFIDADGGANVGAHNLTSGRPSYVDVFTEDYHLRRGSLGEDEGDPFISDELTNLDAVLIDFDHDMRPTNSGPDMGADEINSCLIKVGTRIFSVLQTAVDYAESNDISDLRIARGECRGVVEKNGTEQVAYISENLNLIGSLRRTDFSDPNDYNSIEVGTVSTLINAAGEGRAIYIAGGAEVYFQHVALINGNAFATDSSSDNGGAVYNANGAAYFDESFLCQSYAQDGAGYYGASTSLTDMTGTTVGRCTPAQVTEDENGGVEYVNYFTLFGNAAERNGGGVYIDGVADFRNVGLWYNYAGVSGSGNGGGIYNTGSNNRIVNGVIYNNTVPNNGAGVYNSGSNFQLLHNTIRGNEAENQGGGVYNSGSGFNMNSSIIYTNTAAAANGGGGLFSTGGAALTYNNFHANAPNDSSAGIGANPIVGNPGLLGIYVLSVDSRNIDAADPALLSLVDFDVSTKPRPDGTNLIYEPPRGLFADVGAYEYLMDFGCEIAPANDTRPAAPGEVLTYTLSIINVGNPPYTAEDFWLSNGYTDTITITVESQAQGWAEFEGGEVQTVELGWRDYYPYGETTSRVLTITVPTTATVGMNEVVDLKCQSASLPIRTGNARVIAEIGNQDGVTVVPNYFDSAQPGDVLTYTQTVINLSNDTQTYRLTPSAGPRHASAVLLDSDTLSPTTGITVTLSPSGTQGFTTTTYLEVTILGTAMAGDTATPSVIATDVDDPLVFGANRNEITILPVPGTRYVATLTDGGSDTTNCTDPLLPCATIQHAIDQAVAGDEVLVAGGIYRDYSVKEVGGDPLYQNVFIDKDITIRGGFDSGDEYTIQQPITNAVILDGANERRGIYVADGISATVSSLFVQNGNAAPSASYVNGSTRDYGGGIYNVNGNITITGTWILTSQAKFGGGLYHAVGDLTLNNSVFAGNTNLNPSGTLGDGAGLFMADGTAVLENNTFVGNQAVNGGDSGLVGEGSAIYQAGGTATLVNHIFQDNEAVGGENKYAVYVTGTAVITPAYNLYHNQTNPINVACWPWRAHRRRGFR